MNAYLEALEINNRDGEAMNGIGLILTDEAKAVEWFKKSADAGCRDGMYNLGCAYYYGTGIKQSYSIAREWFERSDTNEAHLKLGNIYRLGYGVIIDGWKAYQHYVKARRSDLSDCRGEAYNALGVIVEYNVLKGKAPKHMFNYYRKSAEEGYPLGMYNVARCYINGLGTDVDRDLGWEWMRKAAAAGIDEAKNFLKGTF